MKLVRLSLENFRRHRATELEFPDGVTAVVGPNGAGKSTILEAIAFALFGDAGTKKELVRSEDAAPGDAVRVRLDLEVGGQAVRVVRELRGKAQSPIASLEVGGHLQVQPVSGSSEQVTKAVERLLGLDASTFYRTVVARQRDLDAIARLKPAQRREFILDLAGIQAIDGAITRARERRAAVRVQAEEAARHVGDEAALAAKVEAARADERLAAQAVVQAEAAAIAAEQAAASAHAALEAARAEHAERLALEAGAQTTQHRADLLRAQAQRAAAECAAAEREASAVLLLRQRVDILAEAPVRLANAQGLVLVRQRRTVQVTRLAQEEAALARAEAAVAAIAVPVVPDLAPVAMAAESALSGLNRAERDRALAEQAAAHAKSAARRLVGLEGSAPCPTCLQPVTGEHLESERRQAAERLAAAEAALAAAESALAAARAEATQAKATLASLQEQTRKAEALSRQREIAARQADALRASVAALREALPADPGPEEDLQALRRQAAEAQAAQAALHAAEAAAARLPSLRAAALAAEQAAQAAAAELADLRLRLASRGDAGSAAAVSRAQQADAAARSALSAAKDRHTKALLAQRSAEHALALALADLERDHAARERLQGLRSELARWTAVVGAAGGGLLERFREHLVARTAPAINQEASQLLALFTQGRYTELLLDDSYEIHLGDGGRFLPLERFSGGEQDLAHLALRLGISRLLANRAGAADIRFLALDEVFSSLDSERCDALLGALRGLTGLYGQVLAVTHLERLRDSFDAVVQVKLADGAASVSLHNG